MFSPAIVIVAYNRPGSVERLLYSLKRANIPQNTKLIISIDRQTPEDLNVKNVADAFEWSYGEKEVLYQEQRLGLKKHVLQCGDLSNKYGSVIILEDDLFVSPYFYDYAIKALDYYGNDDIIGGVSLFNYTYEDLYELPFIPLNDNSDVYFLQFPSSLGQAWTAKQWHEFRTWLNEEPDLSKIPISELVYNWPKTSWKKLFGAFLVDKSKYFVFPRLSLTTNFNDKGTHKDLDINYNGQVQLRLFEGTYEFKNIRDSWCIYDAHFELNAETVKKFCPELADIDFELDLYSHKEFSRIKSDYVITSRPSRKSLFKYQRVLKPHELNILMCLKGEELSLCRKEDILPVKKRFAWMLSEFRYYYESYPPTMRFTIYNRMKHSSFFSKLMDIFE